MSTSISDGGIALERLFTEESAERLRSRSGGSGEPLTSRAEARENQTSDTTETTENDSMSITVDPTTGLTSQGPGDGTGGDAAAGDVVSVGPAAGEAFAMELETATEATERAEAANRSAGVDVERNRRFLRSGFPVPNFGEMFSGLLERLGSAALVVGAIVATVAFAAASDE